MNDEQLELYQKYMRNISLQINLEFRIARALQAAYHDGIVEGIKTYTKTYPLLNTGWVNIYKNMHSNVISVGKKIFATRKEAVCDKHRDKDNLIYVATTRVDW